MDVLELSRFISLLNTSLVQAKIQFRPDRNVNLPNLYEVNMTVLRQTVATSIPVASAIGSVFFML